MGLTLEIITPSRIMLSEKADSVTIPGVLGEIGVLPGHIPLVTSLNSGVLTYQQGSITKKLAVHFGLAEVKNDAISILSELAEASEELDPNRAKKAQDKAEEAIKKVISDPDIEKLDELQKSLQKAITRQLAASS